MLARCRRALPQQSRHPSQPARRPGAHRGGALATRDRALTSSGLHLTSRSILWPLCARVFFGHLVRKCNHPCAADGTAPRRWTCMTAQHWLAPPPRHRVLRKSCRMHGDPLWTAPSSNVGSTALQAPCCVPAHATARMGPIISGEGGKGGGSVIINRC